MINEYDKVRILSNGIVGEVIDIFEADGKTVYTVESERKNVDGGFGIDGYWKRFECLESELEKV